MRIHAVKVTSNQYDMIYCSVFVLNYYKLRVINSIHTMNKYENS